MRDRHSPWFNHNLELVLWGFTTFALLVLIAQAIHRQNERHVRSLVGGRQPMSQSTQSPEIGE